MICVWLRAQEVDARAIDGFIAKRFSLAELTAQVDAVLACGA